MEFKKPRTHLKLPLRKRPNPPADCLHLQDRKELWRFLSVLEYLELDATIVQEH